MFRNFLFLAVLLLAGCDVQTPQPLPTAAPEVKAPVKAVSHEIPAVPEPQIKPDPVAVAISYLGETEDLGPNRSANINRWNKFCGVPAGSFWCSSFVSWCYSQANYAAPVTAWSPSFFENRKTLVPFSDLQRNDAIGYFMKKQGRIAHIGLMETIKGSYVVTIEGNTSDSSGIERNGGGVYRKYRSSKLLNDQRNKFTRFHLKKD